MVMRKRKIIGDVCKKAVGSVSISLAIEEIITSLQKQGYTVDIEQRHDSIALEVTKGELKASVLFEMKEQVPTKVFLSFKNEPGITILKCEEPDRVKSCIEKLLKTLAEKQA